MLKSTIYTLIIAMLIAIVSIAGYFYSVVYVGGMGTDLGDMYNKSNDLSKQEESLNSIKRVAQNADQRNSEISKYIVPVENEGSIQFVKTIEDTADRYGLKYNTMDIGIVSDDSLTPLNKEYLSIKESVVGPDYSIAEFVKKLEVLPFNAKVKSYSLTRLGVTQMPVVVQNGASAKNNNSNSNQQLDLEILVIKEK